MDGEFVEQHRVVARLDQDGDVVVVFRRGADHGRTADIDVLDAVGKIAAARDGGFERIEIDDQNIDRADAVRAHRLRMLGIAADRQQPAMHRRMQRLDAAVHHFRKFGQFAHLDDRQAGIAQRHAGAAGRDELDAEPG